MSWARASLPRSHALIPAHRRSAPRPSIDFPRRRANPLLVGALSPYPFASASACCPRRPTWTPTTSLRPITKVIISRVSIHDHLERLRPRAPNRAHAAADRATPGKIAISAPQKHDTLDNLPRLPPRPAFSRTCSPPSAPSPRHLRQTLHRRRDPARVRGTARGRMCQRRLTESRPDRTRTARRIRSRASRTRRNTPPASD